MQPGLNRALVLLYLLSLALLPWSKFPPFPWLHENAQWSDLAFALAAALWLLECWRRREWPRLKSLHIAMGLYLLAATLSLLLAAPDRATGAMKLLGMAELSMIAIVTSDLSRRPAILQKISCVVAATSLVVAGAAIAGEVLFYAGVWTRLMGAYGDHLIPSPAYARAQAAFSHPNLLASFCVFAAGVNQMAGAGLAKKARALVHISLWTTVALTFSHGVLAFILAASVRRARTRRSRCLASALCVLFVPAVVSLSFLNWSINPGNPALSRVRWDVPSGREHTVRSALKTLATHPVLGSGPGTSPGWFREQPYDSHLTPLNIAATLGLPALGAFVCLFLILWRDRRRPTDLSLWGAFAGLALDSLVTDIEDFRHLWVMIGLADARPAESANNAAGPRNRSSLEQSIKTDSLNLAHGRE